MQGARAVQASIIEKFRNADIGISIVWIKKLAGDSVQTASKASKIFSDHRVSQFYDHDQIVGKEVANRLGWNGQVAWDIYLFYQSGAEWNETPPQPIHWMHQLKDKWANKAHFCTGDDLVNELYKAMTILFDRA